MSDHRLPLLGVRKYARKLIEIISNREDEIRRAKDDYRQLSEKAERFGILSALEMEAELERIQRDIDEKILLHKELIREISEREDSARRALEELKELVVETEELALLQESGIYSYQHALADAVAYQARLADIQSDIKEMIKGDGAVMAPSGWTVNGSAAQGRKMVRETSKLMLRAFNAEADGQVRSLKPYKLDAAIDRLRKVAATIEKLGKTMSISISTRYLLLRIKELKLTADFLHKQAEEKEAEREERARLREERRAQQEMERERIRLEKERQHYENALQALVLKGDENAVDRMRLQLADVQRAIEDVDYRAANIRAGYVYVISNIGSFGEHMVKIGMTRRLNPMDRVRELSDASVPFNFDVHALFFSKDAVGIEAEMHKRLAAKRVNQVNLRREFFHASPTEAKMHLKDLAGELLQFHDIPEAAEYRESLGAAAPAG